jgi:hypothetical protein
MGCSIPPTNVLKSRRWCDEFIVSNIYYDSILNNADQFARSLWRALPDGPYLYFILP